MRGGRGQDVREAGGHRQHLLSDVLGQLVGQVGGIGNQHARDTLHCSRGLRGSIAARSDDQHRNLTPTLRGCGDGVEGGRLERGVVVFSDDQCCHVTFLRSCRGTEENQI